MEPSILVLDEPSSNLDPAGRRELADVLEGLDVAMLMITHDLPYALQLCERSVVLAAGQGTRMRSRVPWNVSGIPPELRDAARRAAERAGVAISGPLGLCFLPAFICLGIVPVVVGLASSVLGSI